VRTCDEDCNGKDGHTLACDFARSEADRQARRAAWVAFLAAEMTLGKPDAVERADAALACYDARCKDGRI
jgi:hypothetical protein